MGRHKQIVAWLGVAAVIGGCAKEGATPAILEANAHPYVHDVPLPAGFKLDERQSEDRVAEGHRAVKHVYQGRGSLQAVKGFYQHNMPLVSWVPVKHSLNKGVYLLEYQKGNERCEIRIERMPSGFLGTVTQVRATIQANDTWRPDRPTG